MKSINSRTLAHRCMALLSIGLTFSVVGSYSALAQTKTWIGGTGNWNVSANWSPSGIPGSTSVVLIYSGDVSIPSGYTASSKSIEVNNGAKLRVLSVAELQINGSTNDGIRSYGLNSEIINHGTIKIGNTSSITIRGISMATGGKFTNHTGSLLEINRISNENGMEIRDINTKFTNFGNIRIGNLASIQYTCIWVHSGGQFENKSNGTMELSNTNWYHGLGIAGTNTLFTNAGVLKIGNSGKINFYGLAVETGASFHNQIGSTVEIDSVAGYDGLVITGNSTFNNSGHLKVGNNNSIGWRCLTLGSGSKLTNLNTGVIELNRTKNNWNAVELNNVNTKLSNQGLIKIGNIAPINLSCIRMSNESQIENTSTGVLELNQSVFAHGIYMNGYVKLDNYGLIKMGFNKKIHDIGILMETGSVFNNHTNALIEIDSIYNRDGIRCSGGPSTFNNSGTIKIGNTHSVSGHGISVSGTGVAFNNQPSGIIEVNRSWTGINVIGSAKFNNSGIAKLGNLEPLVYTGVRLAGDGTTAFTNLTGSLLEIDHIPNSFAVDPGDGPQFSNYGTVKIGMNHFVFHGIGTFWGTGIFNNYGSLEFHEVMSNGIHSNQTLNNHPGAFVFIPAAGKLRVEYPGIINNSTGALVQNLGTVFNNGIINNSGTFDNQNIYKGTGAFNTSLFSNPAAGTVAPGLSPGCLQFTNGWASVGKLEIEINGPSACSDYDQLQVTGNAQAGGDLYINFNYPPACGATFQLISASSHSGNFSNIFITPNTVVASYSDGLLSILDVVSPSITCPSNVSYTTTPGDCGPVPSSEINLGTPVTSDDCGVAGYSNNAPSNYPLGVKNVKWTVTDLSGNTSTCIQKVTIYAGTCSTPSQVVHTEISESSAKILWNAGVPCATQYQLRIRYELTPGVWSSWTAWASPTGPGLEHLFNGLSANTLHHYQIRSKCGTTNSSTVSGWFTTLTAFAGSEDRNREEGSGSYTNQPVTLEFVPNPATTSARILISGFDPQTVEVTMMDLFGKQVFSVPLKPGQNEIELDLLALKVHKGVYLVRVSDGHQQKTGQLVIGH